MRNFSGEDGEEILVRPEAAEQFLRLASRRPWLWVSGGELFSPQAVDDGDALNRTRETSHTEKKHTSPGLGRVCFPSLDP